MHSESKKPEVGRKLKVFADTDLVNNFLKYDKFEVSILYPFWVEQEADRILDRARP